MPISVTYDIDDAADSNDRNRLRVAFQRFGWETIGGTAYRYPPLQTIPAPPSLEDWFNHVVPALMYFRSLVEARGIPVTNFTIDGSVHTGWRAGAGATIQNNAQLACGAVPATTGNVLSDTRLRDWVRACTDNLAAV